MLAGSHKIKIMCRNAERVTAFYEKRIKITRNKQKYYYIDGDLHMEQIRSGAEATMFFKMKNITERNVPVFINFFNVPGEKDFLYFGQMYMRNNPFYLKKGMSLGRNISIITRQTAEGLYSGYFGVEVLGRCFLHNVSFNIISDVDSDNVQNYEDNIRINRKDKIILLKLIVAIIIIMISAGYFIYLIFYRQ
jgi:hypothetical protein